MKRVTLTEGDKKLIKTAETVLAVNLPTEKVLMTIPLFAETIGLLREKFTHTETQSVAKHKAKSAKEAVVADVSTEKGDLALYVSKARGQFTEFLKREKSSQLANMMPHLTLSKLSRQNAVLLVTTVNSFVSTVEELNTETLAQCGINEAWLATLKNKVQAYKSNNAAKETLKSNQPKETNNFRAVMTDIKDYLTTMTNLVGGYENVAPDFYKDCAQILMPPKKKSPKNIKGKMLPKATKKSMDKKNTDKIEEEPPQS